MFRVEVWRTIDDIEDTMFNKLSDGAFYSWEWFKTLENTRVFKIKPMYFTVYDQSKVVAIAPCFIEYESQYFTLEDLSRWARRLRTFVNLAGGLFQPPLIGESPCSFQSKILIKEGYDKRTILGLISNKIDEACRTERILFSSFPFVSEFDELLLKNLPSLGYVKIPFISTAYLNIKWPSFDYYLAEQKYKVRKNVRREINNNKKSGVTVREEKDVRRLSPILSGLHSNLFLKHTGKKSSFSASFFDRLSEDARDKTRLFVARRKNKVVGFSLCLAHRGILDVYIAGFDYDCLTKTDFTYFNTVYYEPIRTAIQEGFKKIHFRPGALRTKLQRGCKIDKLNLFIKGHPAILNHALAQYARAFYANKKIEDRIQT